MKSVGTMFFVPIQLFSVKSKKEPKCLAWNPKKKSFWPVNRGRYKSQALVSYIFVYYLRLSIVPFSYGQNRKEQVVLTRCRIGHSRLTHSYLLNNEERPECIPCNSNFSLKYVLIECVVVADVRQTFYNTKQGRIQDLWLGGAWVGEGSGDRLMS